MPPVRQSNTNYKYLPCLLEAGDEYPIDADVEDIETRIANLESGKADKTEETQAFGWTSVKDKIDTYQDMDLRPLLAAGKTKFTILFYVRKGNVRQIVKFELRTKEKKKIWSKVNKSMVCIAKGCVDPNDNTKLALLRQCMEQVQEGGSVVEGFIKLKYALYTLDGTLVSALDNFEWCMYAE